MIYPPRPENVISRDDLINFESKNYIAQAKLNGSNCVIISDGFKHVYFNRHGQPMSIPPKLDIVFNPGIYVGEYMNKFQAMEEDKPFDGNICIHDILKFGSFDMVGTKYSQRIETLNNIFTPSYFNGYLFRVSEKVFLIESFLSNFTHLYDELITIKMVEGLVIKNQDTRLLPYTRNDNIIGQYKARKPTKSYRL